MTDGITKRNGNKLWGFRSDTRKKKSLEKIARHWTGLSRGVVEPPALKGLKTWPEKATALLI